jgi:hypothetical protein
MDPSTINASTFTLSALGAGAAVSPSIKAVEGTVTYVAATWTAVLTPAADLGGFTFYDATVSGDVQDTSGNTMGADYTWRFRTSDLVAPDVASTDPADGETDVGDVPAVTVTFTEDVNEDTVDGNSFRVNKGAEQVAGSVGANGDVATFTPNDDLECSETFTGLVTTAIEDLGGNPLASNYAWTWTMAPGRWMRTYNAGGVANRIWRMAETTDGGYIIAGNTSNVIGAFQSAWIAKLDVNGNPEWQKSFGDATNDDIFASVQQTADGGYVAAGFTHLGGGGLTGTNCWVMKFDADGNRQWETQFGGAADDEAYAIQEQPAGGYIVVGATDTYGGAGFNVFYASLTAAGTVLAPTMTVSTVRDDYAYSVEPTSDGGHVVAGANGDQFWLIKLNTLTPPNVSWEHTYGAAGDINTAYSAVQTAEGGYIILGETRPGGGIRDMWALKVDKDGVFITPPVWQFRYGRAENDSGYSVKQTSDGGYIMGGRTQISGANYDGWIVKVDSLGAVEWENRYGDDNADAIYTVLENTGGGYAAAGVRDVPDTVDVDSWVMQLDLTGDIDASCTEIVPTSLTRAAVTIPSGVSASNVAQPVVQASAVSIEVDTTATEETQCQSPCAPLTP